MFKHKSQHKHPSDTVDIGITTLSINLVTNIMKVNLTWTTPKFRDDGITKLPLNEIKTTTVRRNGAIIGTPVALVGAMTFSDTTPLTGSDTYTIETVTTDSLVSKLSNLVTIAVTNANPAAAVTDLVGVLIP